MLKKICEISSPASGEDKIKEFIINELKNYTDSYYTDSFGNLVFLKEGKGEKTVIECGVDEPFIMVSETEEDTLRFTAPPHFKADIFSDKKMVSKDGLVYEVSSDAEEKVKISDLYTEFGTEIADCGNLLTLYPGYTESEKTVSAYNLSYKAPVFSVIDAVKTLKNTEKNLVFLFSVHKCLAGRGLRAFLSDNNVESVLSIVCTKANEYVNCGDGVVICVKDKSCATSVNLKNKLCDIAEKNSIEYKPAIISENLGVRNVLATGYGAESSILCMPFDLDSENREEIFKNDIKNVTKLLISYCKQ